MTLDRRTALRRCAHAAARVGMAQLHDGIGGGNDPDLWSAGPRQAAAVASAFSTLTGDHPHADLARVESAQQQAVLALAQPAPVLLALGGDSRVHPVGGRNSYGLPLWDPSPQLRASSCTSTPPDSTVLSYADEWRHGLLAGLLGTAALPSARDLRLPVRDGIARRLGIAGDVASRIALSPSGTDALLLFSTLALAATDRPVRVVMVGSRESGGRSPDAARGLAFDRYTPLGGEREPGTTLSGIDSDRLWVTDVPIRDAHGRVRPSNAVRVEVEAHIIAAHRDGAAVLVHLMESAKTAITAAEPSWVRRWSQRWPQWLHVAVDAAQFRTDRARLISFLSAGASVLITGSKALSAPPFCGAVVLSPRLADTAAGMTELPAGLADYLSAADLPDCFTGTVRGLTPVNFGLLARWTVALREWQDVDALPADDRRSLCAGVVDGWRRGLARLPGVEVLPALNPTMVSFVLYGPHGPLSVDQTRAVYRQISTEQGIYLGQPVELAPGRATVLRLAVGAAMLNRLAAGCHTVVDQVQLAVDRVSDRLAEQRASVQLVA